MTVFEYDYLGRLITQYMPFDTGFDLTLEPRPEFAAIQTARETAAPACQTKEYYPDGKLMVETDYIGQVVIYYYYDTASMYNGAEFQGLPGQLRYKDYYRERPAGETLPDVDAGAIPAGGDRFAYTYDKLGRRVCERIISFGVSGTDILRDDSWAYSYDSDGNLDFTISPQGTIDYSYNPITGQKTSTRVPNADFTTDSQVEYGYDEMGRLAQVSARIRNGVHIIDETTIYSYNAVGSRGSTTLPNDIFTEYTYNALNRLTDLVNYQTASKTASVSSFTYKLAASGMRRRATEVLQYPSGSQSPVAQYAYDNLDRLISEDNRDGGVGYNATYVYDLAGNRKSRVVIAPNGTLTTTYDYWPGTDKLWTETNDEPVSMLPYGDQLYFAYADGSGGIYYQKSGSEARIGQFGALVRGLPSMWNSAVFYTLMLALPIAFFWPALIRQWRRIRMAADPETSPDLKLWHRMLCVLLSYIFLVGPEAFQITSQATVQFGQISTLAWGKGGRIIEYGYDANGSLTSKTTREGTVTVEQVNYYYNLQNRLASVETITDPAGTNERTVTHYQYDPSGIRVQKLTDAVYQTDYLVDAANQTGYAQVLQETRWDTSNPAAPVPLGKTDYVIGDDVISQTKSTWDGEHSVWAAAPTQYLLYDGHGSTRQLTLPDGSVADSYSYDGYGVMLQDDSGADAASNAATSLLYSGEQFDPSSQMYYLRARYYNPLNGLFNRMDDFAGHLRDPQSLHKYAYCHNNPVNAIDPSGLFVDWAALGRWIHAQIGTMYEGEHIGRIHIGRSIPGLAGALMPDIMDFALKEIAEIKPLSPYGFYTGPIQLAAYLAAANLVVPEKVILRIQIAGPTR